MPKARSKSSRPRVFSAAHRQLRARAARLSRRDRLRRNDPRITGIVVRIAPLDRLGKTRGNPRSSVAFRASHKPSICYLGYDGIGNPEYYLASACQQIWLVPSNPVSIRGMMAEALFFRGTLDKLKIIPEFYHIAEYKTAYNMFTEKKFTPPHREEVESVLRSIYSQYVNDAAQAAHMDPAKFESSVNAGPLLSSDAVPGQNRRPPGLLGSGAGFFQIPLSADGIRFRSVVIRTSVKDDGSGARNRRRACHGPDRFRRVANHSRRRIRDGRRFGGLRSPQCA